MARFLGLYFRSWFSKSSMLTRIGPTILILRPRRKKHVTGAVFMLMSAVSLVLNGTLKTPRIDMSSSTLASNVSLASENATGASATPLCKLILSATIVRTSRGTV